MAGQYQRGGEVVMLFLTTFRILGPFISRERLKLITSNTFIKAYKSSNDFLLLVKFM